MKINDSVNVKVPENRPDVAKNFLFQLFDHFFSWTLQHKETGIV